MATLVPDVRRLTRKDLGALSEGVVRQDADGRIIDANASAAPILGLSRDELLGRTPHDPRWYAVHEDGWP
ncbi:MAG: PAS domain-containing protein [Proteobacteria bacterium]|nr:PAS domain-containing protein [Pseudomonadota bacterium]